MSSLTLDAEALYADLLRGLQTMLASYGPQDAAHLVGVASGGVWLADLRCGSVECRAGGPPPSGVFEPVRLSHRPH